ncbi:MAG: hypothetical protein ABJP70_01910 [Erythrobacter sp.]
MKRALRLVAAGIGVAGLTLPSIAAAQSKCPVVRAALSEDKSALEGIAVTINSKGLLDATRYGVAGALRNAQDCALDSPKYGFDLYCDWSFESGEERKAEKQLDTMRRALDDCVPGVLEKKEPIQYSDQQLADFAEQYGRGFVERLKNLEVLDDYELTVELKNGDAVDIELDMTRDKKSGRISVNFNIYRY